MSIFKGAGVAIVTPFKNYSVDFQRLGKLIDWQVDEGIDAIISCGTTGEASTLTNEEHIETVAFTVERVAGRVPVIAGAGSNDTAHAVHMSRELEKTGVNGLLIVTPYYNKCSQRGLVKHYTTIADSVDIPIILYSVPGRTGVNITPATVSELSEHPNIVGIKEASGNLSQVVDIAKSISEDFDLYSGNDDIIVPLLSLGSVGAISAVANILPKDTHKMIHAYLSGDILSARTYQLHMKSLIDALFLEVNPIPVKAALSMMGFIDPEYRLPLCEADNKTLYEILIQMQAYGIMKKA